MALPVHNPAQGPKRPAHPYGANVWNWKTNRTKICQCERGHWVVAIVAHGYTPPQSRYDLAAIQIWVLYTIARPVHRVHLDPIRPTVKNGKRGYKPVQSCHDDCGYRRKEPHAEAPPAFWSKSGNSKSWWRLVVRWESLRYVYNCPQVLLLLRPTTMWPLMEWRWESTVWGD